MRKIITGALGAALAAGLAPAVHAGGATAAGPATIPVSASDAVLGTFAREGEVDRYRVRLERGQDYAIVAFGGEEGAAASVTVTDPSGRKVATATSAGSEVDEGAGFRAGATGWYNAAAFDVPGGSAVPPYPHGYGLKVAPDCRGDARTRCVLRPGRSREAWLLSADDSDWYALELAAGARYTLAVQAGGPAKIIQVLDDEGRVLAQQIDDPEAVLDFVAPRSGRGYAVIRDDDDYGGPYTASLGAAR